MKTITIQIRPDHVAEIERCMRLHGYETFEEAASFLYARGALARKQTRDAMAAYGSIRVSEKGYHG